jgi:hypothetical protein
MTAKLYSRVPSVSPLKPLSGQAKVVWESLTDTPTLAKDVDAVAGPRLRTRQDTYRVTLYYILVLKSRGLVQATEQAPATELEQLLAGPVLHVE